MASSNTKRRRLGNLFNLKEESPDTTAAPAQRPALGGSSTATSKDSETTPIENHGQVSGVPADHHLVVKKQTGEVVDDETGEVVSTVTTTTTTTTTTTKRSKSPLPGSKTNDGVQSNVQQPQQSQQHLSPESAAPPASAPQRPPELQHLDTSTGAGASTSYEYSGRQTRSRTNATSPLQASPSTGGETRQGGFQSLKDAAIGLHGVGETLRGTLNSEIDQRYPRRDTNKASAANLKNQATLQAGREEMGRIQRQKTPERTWGVTGTENAYGAGPWAEPHAPPDPIYHPQSPPHEEDRLRKRKSLSSMPASFSPESNGQIAEKNEGIFKKMLKGKKSPGP